MRWSLPVSHGLLSLWRLRNTFVSSMLWLILGNTEDEAIGDATVLLLGLPDLRLRRSLLSLLLLIETCLRRWQRLNALVCVLRRKTGHPWWNRNGSCASMLLGCLPSLVHK